MDRPIGGRKKWVSLSETALKFVRKNKPAAKINLIPCNGIIKILVFGYLRERKFEGNAGV